MIQSAVKTGNQNVALPAHMTVEVVEQLMGLPVGSVSPVAWLIMTEQAMGSTDVVIAKNLEIGIADLIQIKEITTGLEGDEAKNAWDRGVISLKTAAILNQSAVARTWDAVERLAVEKLAASLQSMKTNGNATEMLSIATAANKAVRRHQGEGRGPMGRGPGLAADGVSLTLESGSLGTIRLNLNPAIQKQISNPTRVIDETAHKVPSKTSGLQMLGLKDTRQLAIIHDSGLDVKPEPVETMTFDPSILDE